MFRHLIFLTLLAPLTSVHANDSERAELVRLVHALESTRPLLVKAELASDPYDAYSINYRAAQEDLDRIIHGLQEVTQLPRREPRKITDPENLNPITGRYVP